MKILVLCDHGCRLVEPGRGPVLFLMSGRRPVTYFIDVRDKQSNCSLFNFGPYCWGESVSPVCPVHDPFTIEQAVSGGNISDLYSGVARFESRRDIDYPGRYFLWFSSVSPGKWWDSTLNYVRSAFFQILSYSSFNIYLTIRRYIVWATDSVVK
jgi:hypothetical protein